MVIPLHDDNPTTTKPYVTVGIMIACVLVYVWQHLLLSHAGHAAGGVCLRRGPGGAHRARIAAGGARACSRAWATVLTSMFMHGGFWHLAGNMLYLWIFGNNIEDAMGHVRFFIFYLSVRRRRGVRAGTAQSRIGRPDGGRQRRHLRRARRLHAAVSARARVVRVAAGFPDRAARTIPGNLGAGGMVRHATRHGWHRRDAAHPANPRAASPSARTSADSSRVFVLVTFFKRRDVPLWRRY